MRRKTTFLALLLTFAATALISQEAATEAAPDVEEEAAVAPQDEKATFIFFRLKRMQGAALNTSVFIDGVEIADLDNGTYLKVALDPGKHTFRSDDEKDAFEMEIGPGEEYYVKVDLVRGLWKGHGQLFVLDEAQGIEEFNRKPLKPAKDVRVPEMVISD